MKANIELAKLRSHLFQNRDTLKKPCEFKADDLTMHYKIVQCKDTFQLKTVQQCDIHKSNTCHHVNTGDPDDSNNTDPIMPDNSYQSH